MATVVTSALRPAERQARADMTTITREIVGIVLEPPALEDRAEIEGSDLLGLIPPGESVDQILVEPQLCCLSSSKANSTWPVFRRSAIEAGFRQEGPRP